MVSTFVLDSTSISIPAWVQELAVGLPAAPAIGGRSSAATLIRPLAR
jgi:hypothetical protein